MKTLVNHLIILAFMISAPVMMAQSQLTKADRSKAAASLKATQKALQKTVSGLTINQLNYKPSPDSWSVAECIEHIGISENNITMMMHGSLKADADPSQRAELKMSDEQVFNLITDRSQKVKTRPEFEPKNSFGSAAASLDAFTKKRRENIKYVKKTDDDLRNHFFDFPFGKVDSYQIIMFMSGHTKRHTDQIKEVIASSGFPSA